MRFVTNVHGLTTPVPEVTPAYQYNRLANPARTEVRDAAGVWLATFTDGCRTVTTRGAERVFTQQDLPIDDLFNRTRSATGWGNATNGGGWSAVGGTSPGNYSVGAEGGTVVVDTENTSRRLNISDYAIKDCDVTTRFKTDKKALGANQVVSLMMGYQDTNNHYVADVSFFPSAISDTFDRTATGGWGSASSGQAWSTTGGATGDYSVTGGIGQHSIDTVNVSRRTVLSTVSAADVDVTYRVRVNVLAAGASITAGFTARYADSDNHYYFRVRFGSTSTHPIFAAIQKTVAGTSTTLGSEATTTQTHVAGTWYKVRSQALGNTLRMKVWADGASEPGTWDVSVTDGTFTAPGAVGFRSIAQTGSTAATPILVAYDDVAATLDNLANDGVELRIRRRVAGTTTDLGSRVVVSGLDHSAGGWFLLRATMSQGTLRAKVWRDGTTEPVSWTATVTDTTYTNGKVGVRVIANTGTLNLPVTATFSAFHAEGTWVAPPTIRHSTWVRLLSSPFAGTVDPVWLSAVLRDTSPDVLAVALQYITGAPPVLDSSGLQIAGDADYGPLTTSGTRQEGADFNDYLGIPWTYTGVDNPEPAEFRALDCSGHIRMVYGYRLGMKLRLSAPTAQGGNSIPRLSRDITDYGPGVMLINSGSTPPTDLSKLNIGDLVCFDATNESGELDGEIDHLGIYLGTDINGAPRFVSSRKTVNGPTFSDTGGPSVITGSGLYGRTLRKVRRI